MKSNDDRGRVTNYSFTLYPDDYELLLLLSAKLGVSKSNVVRQAVRALARSTGTQSSVKK